MHFEILIEDQSGKEMLDVLVPKIIGEAHTFRVIPYKGIGRIPPNMKGTTNPRKRILLDRLPSLLRGYGNTFQHYPADSPAAVIVVCDLDRECRKEFRAELLNVLNNCHPKSETRFCLAVEEGEAWLLGDIDAVTAAYPGAKLNILSSYTNDSICGTWEKLADAVYKGGSVQLKDWQIAGKAKSEWAKNIAPHMDMKDNKSPSFNYFRAKLHELAGILL
jgi:hypothetical protein